MKMVLALLVVCTLVIACNNESKSENTMADSSSINVSADTSGTTNSTINNSMDTLHKSDSARKDSAGKPR